MKQSQHDASAVGTIGEGVEEIFGGSSLAIEVPERQFTDVSNAEQSRADRTVRVHHDWAAVVGTLVIVLALFAVSVFYFRCLHWIGLRDQFSDEEKALARFVTACFCAAMVGAIARWLTLAAIAAPGVFPSLSGHLQRWIADVVSTALIVTAVLMVLESVSLQMGTVTVTLSGASQQLIIGLAFVLGYFANRARELLHSISRFSFLQGEQNSKAQEQRRSDHKKNGTGDRD